MKHITLMILLAAKGWIAPAQNNAIFSGGNGDGWTIAFFLQPAVNIFTGGTADGYSSYNFLQPGNNIFSGGNGDGWSSAYRSPGTLPVNLLSFKVVRKNNNPVLTWQTANEVNVSYFNIQRSPDAVNFEVVGKVNAAKGSLQNTYEFSDDASAFYSGKIYYRLQIIDKESKVNYSEIKYLALPIELRVTIVPNPIVYGRVNLKIYSPANAKLQLMICNALGTTFFVQRFDAVTGISTRTFNLSNLAPGIYLARVADGFTTHTVKFVK